MFFLPDTTHLIHCHAINFNCVQLVSAYNGLCGSNKNQEVYIFKHETRGIIQTRKGYNKYLHIVTAIRISHPRSVYSTIVCCFVTTCFHTICPWQALAYYYCHWGPSQVWTFSLPLPLPGQVVTAKLLPIAVCSGVTALIMICDWIVSPARGWISPWAPRELYQSWGLE